MNRNKSYRGAFIVSLMFNIVLLFMLSVIGINSTKQNEAVPDVDDGGESAAEMVGTEDALTEIIEVDVPSEDDAMGDGEDLIEVTTTPPAVITTTEAAEKPTTTKKNGGQATGTTTAKPTTAATTTPTTATTTTQKPTTTTTKGSGDNDTGFEDIFITPPAP